MKQACLRGVINVVTGLGVSVGNRLSEHPDIDVISFTGSTAVGRQVAATASRNLKRCSLELGGKNPHIVFADADLDAALDPVVFGVYFNMGEWLQQRQPAASGRAYCAGIHRTCD